MSEQVLSDEQLREAYASVNQNDSEWPHRISLRAVERATIAALAARSGVDVEALARIGARGGFASTCHALRLALAQQEARHAEREAMWREYAEHCSFQNWTDKTKARVVELRRALGLEG